MSPIIKKKIAEDQEENNENYFSVGSKSYGVMTPRSDIRKLLKL